MTTDRPELSSDETASTTERLLHLAVAAGIAILGVVVVLEARDIRVIPAYSRVGPRVIPYLVGAGLIIIGCWLAIEALTGHTAAPSGDDAEDVDLTMPPDWRALGGIAIGLALYWFLIERAGFIIASAILFFIAAYGMGSRRVVRDGMVAVALSTVIYVIFTEGLNLRLPAGWLDAPLSGLGLG